MESEKLHPVRLVDPRMRRPALQEIVFDGPASTTYQTVVPSDPASLNPNFVIQTPSVNSGINRMLRLSAAGSFTIRGTGLKNLINVSNIALRQFALQSMMASCTLNLNDFSVSLASSYQYIQALGLLSNSSENLNSSQSTGACMPDRWSTYAAEAASPGGAFDVAGFGPYNDFGGSGRTADIKSITFSEDETSAVVTFDTSEPLIISPLEYGTTESKSLFGINTLQLTCAYNYFNRGLSYVVPSGTSVSSVDLALTYQGIDVCFITPTDRSLVEKPLKTTYSWTQVSQFTTTVGGTVSPGSSISFSTNSFELPVVPGRYLIFAAPSQNDLQDATQSIPNICFPISQVSVQFGSRGGLLSGATPRQLYDISRRNGVKQSYPIWSGQPVVTSGGDYGYTYCGGPLCISTAADLSLPDDMCPGMSVRTQFTLNGTLKNHTAKAWTNIRVVVLALVSGSITSRDGTTSGSLGGITQAEMKKAKEMSPLGDITMSEALNATGYSGGSWWDSFKQGFMMPINAVKSIAPAILPFIGHGGASVGGAPIGGMSPTAMAGAIIGGRVPRRKARGGAQLMLQ